MSFLRQVLFLDKMNLVGALEWFVDDQADGSSFGLWGAVGGGGLVFVSVFMDGGNEFQDGSGIVREGLSVAADVA